MTTELYVIGTFVAAAVIALCVKPRNSGPATRHLVATRLSGSIPDPHSGWLTLTSHDNGTITIERTLNGEITDDGALSLTIDIIGFDINIQERRVVGAGSTNPTRATALIDFLAQERYHITYRRDQDEIAATFNYRNAPGAHRTFVE